MKDQDIEQANVLSVLSRHIGAGNGIHINELVVAVYGREAIERKTYYGRQLRKHIQALRTEGEHICGTPAAGYYIAATAEELDHTCAFLEKRIRTSAVQLRAMRRKPMLELAGQGRLPS